ncbi:hypothetical protein [Kitasatospora sp. NPDC088548]
MEGSGSGGEHTGEVIVRTSPAKRAKFLQGVEAGEFGHHADPDA